jgi:hypothetical protein
VFFAVTYTASAKGSTAVAVRCEKCAQKYYYKLTCTAIGRGSAPYGIGQEKAKQLAQRMAKKKLWEMLDTEIRAVPCPHCGWYQQAMLRLLRKPGLKLMLQMGVITLIAGCIFVFCAGVSFRSVSDPKLKTPIETVYLFACTALAFLLVGTALLLVRRRQYARFDPNDPETAQQRIELGHRLSITREQAEEVVNPYDD